MHETWIRIPKLQLPPKGEVRLFVPFQTFGLLVDGSSNAIGITDGKTTFLGPILEGLEAEPWFYLAFAFEPNHWLLFLNGECVLETRDNKIVQKVERFRLQSSTPSNVPIRQKDISNWIAKRQSMFPQQQTTSSAHIILSPQQQENDLREIVTDLAEFVSEFQSGRKSRFRYIVPTLRALLLYKANSSTYDPLLLRLASFKLATLPVYVSPLNSSTIDDYKINGLYPDFYGLSCPSVVPDPPCTVLVDFQEYLDSPALYYQGQAISPLVLIEKIANTQSIAHLDQRVPLSIEALKQIPVTFTETSLEYYIVRLAKLTTEIAKLLLEKRWQ